MAGIFISYRRADTGAWAGRIYERLAHDVRRDHIFMDIDNIAPGLDFIEELDRHVAKCDALVAVIGKSWIDARDDNGQRRLDDPNDFVRVEVAAALERGVRVIPVLVDRARMPTAAELPEPLQKLARRNAVELTHARFGSDVQRLVGALKSTASTAKPATAEKTNILTSTVTFYNKAQRSLDSGTRWFNSLTWRSVLVVWAVLLVMMFLGLLK